MGWLSIVSNGLIIPWWERFGCYRFCVPHVITFICSFCWFGFLTCTKQLKIVHASNKQNSCALLSLPALQLATFVACTLEADNHRIEHKAIVNWQTKLAAIITHACIESSDLCILSTRNIHASAQHVQHTVSDAIIELNPYEAGILITLCKLMYPWSIIYEIQFIKETCAAQWPCHIRLSLHLSDKQRRFDYPQAPPPSWPQVVDAQGLLAAKCHFTCLTSSAALTTLEHVHHLHHYS